MKQCNDLLKGKYLLDVRRKNKSPALKFTKIAKLSYEFNLIDTPHCHLSFVTLILRALVCIFKCQHVATNSAVLQ
jgi:hypothetical protein